MIDFVGKRKWYFLVSGIIILIGVIFLLSVGLQRGIEFTGGTMVTVRFEQTVTQEQLREELAVLGHDDAIIQLWKCMQFRVASPATSRGTP